MTAADCVKHKWLQQRPAATPPTPAATIAKTASASAKSRLKSESPTPLASESSEDSTETIEDAEDDDENENGAGDGETTEQHDNEHSEKLAQLCSTHDLEVSLCPGIHYICT